MVRNRRHKLIAAAASLTTVASFQIRGDHRQQQQHDVASVLMPWRGDVHVQQVSQPITPDTSLLPTSELSLYIYQFNSSLFNELHTCYGTWDGDNNFYFDVQALDMVQRTYKRVYDPALADAFLVDACLVRTYFYVRETRGHASVQKFECDLIAQMRSVGSYWDLRRRRHILTSLECPRHALTPEPTMLASSSLIGRMPNLWRNDVNGPVMICLQQSTVGSAASSRTLQVPYVTVKPTIVAGEYRPSPSGLAYRDRIVPDPPPAASRHTCLFFSGSFHISTYDRSFLREAMDHPCNVINVFDDRRYAPTDKDNTAKGMRRAKLVVAPPGDTPESKRIYDALEIGTMVLLLTDDNDVKRKAGVEMGSLVLPEAEWENLAVRVDVSELYPNGTGSPPMLLNDHPAVAQLLASNYRAKLRGLQEARDVVLWGTSAQKEQFSDQLTELVEARIPACRDDDFLFTQLPHDQTLDERYIAQRAAVLEVGSQWGAPGSIFSSIECNDPMVHRRFWQLKRELLGIEPLAGLARKQIVVIGNGPLPFTVNEECIEGFDEVVRFNDFSHAVSSKATIHVVNSIVKEPAPDAWMLLSLECVHTDRLHPDLRNDSRLCRPSEEMRATLCASPPGIANASIIDGSTVSIEDDPSRGFLLLALMHGERNPQILGFTDDGESSVGTDPGKTGAAHLVAGHHILEEHKVLVDSGILSLASQHHKPSKLTPSIEQGGIVHLYREDDFCPVAVRPSRGRVPWYWLVIIGVASALVALLGGFLIWRYWWKPLSGAPKGALGHQKTEKEPLR